MHYNLSPTPTFLKSIITLLSLFFNGSKGQILWSWERAEELYDKFKALPHLDYGKHCANPWIMRERFVEVLLESSQTVLQEDVIDSIAFYNRWEAYQGYRCIPSKYECKRVSGGNTNLWKCQCPTLGNQTIVQLTDRNGVIGCIHRRGTFGDGHLTDDHDPFWTYQDDCKTGIDPQYQPPLPVPYKNSVVCATYSFHLVENSPERPEAIENGLHFQTLTCPRGQTCRLYEFPGVQCTEENLEKLWKWIDPGPNKKTHKVKYRRANRLATWPPCVCTPRSRPAVEFPRADERQELIEDCLKELPKAQFNVICDRTRLSRMEECINGNWYLLPEPQYEKFLQMCRDFNGIGLECEESKGLECDSTLGQCVCKPAPYLPGWKPALPNSVNSRGYCKLDSGSDCHYEYPFECSDGEKCLLANFYLKCSQVNWIEAEKLRNISGFENYQKRCYCTNETEEFRFPDLFNDGKSKSNKTKSEGNVIETVKFYKIFLIILLVSYLLNSVFTSRM